MDTLPPLISSQRHIDPKILERKFAKNQVFVVRIATVTLRGRLYRVLIDGHHNLAAARLIGVEPAFRPPAAKWARIQRKTPKQDFERLLINNLTDCDWYYVETGKVVEELL